ILDGTIASADIGTDVIAAGNIATGGVATAEILDGTIGTADVAQSVRSGSVHAAGTLAARPVAAAGNAGYLYFATDVNGGTLYRSDGTTWSKVAAGNSVTSADLRDGTITGADVATDTLPAPN